MAHCIPTVRDGHLKDLATNGNLAETIVVGMVAWYAWLERHCSFRFEMDCMVFTARKEQRPGGWYWYAYRRKLGRLRSAYLGKSEELTQERLSSVAQVLEEAHEGNGSVSTHSLDHHKIMRDDASQIHPVSVDLSLESFTVVEQMTSNDSASKHFTRKLHVVEISPVPSSSSMLLTRREKEVLRLLTMGLTNAQIAERLVVSLSTVNTHVRSIYDKLEVTSRSAATRYAVEHHLI
jgi:DNA-binding NarL/FixJ family response regulator